MSPSQPLEMHVVFKQSFIINQCVIFYFLIAIPFDSHTFLCNLLWLLSLNYVPFPYEFCEARND